MTEFIQAMILTRIPKIHKFTTSFVWWKFEMLGPRARAPREGVFESLFGYAQART